MGRTCEFHDTDEEIVDQIIEKCYSNKLRKGLLSEPDLSLNKLIQIAQAMEAANRQVKQYQDSAVLRAKSHGSDSEQEVGELLNSLSFNTHGKKIIKSGITSKQRICYCCGSKNHYANMCEVTKGKCCNTCGCPGHFSNVCRAKKVQYIHHKTIRLRR